MLTIVLILSLAIVPWNSLQFVQGDPVELLEGGEPLSQDQRHKIIEDYFKGQGLSVDLDEHEYDQYEPEVVRRMQTVVENDKAHMDNYARVCEINSLIHSILAKHLDADVAVLQAIDLIVPRSFSQAVLEMAKDNLAEFHMDLPDLSLELLKWAGEDLEAGSFHTQDAIRFLEGGLHNWVPLGRLNKFIEDHGETQEVSRE